MSPSGSRARTLPQLSSRHSRPPQSPYPSASLGPGFTLNDVFTFSPSPSSNDFDNVSLSTFGDDPWPSSSRTHVETQLVIDHNHVGPGHDMSLRPYVCDWSDCDKAFARRSDLQRHKRIHTGDRPFTCPDKECGKSFIQRSALTVHIRTHTGEKPHMCETCEKPFADSSSLARHRRIHTGARPYACTQADCGRSFARRNTFLKHFKSQHPGIPAPSTNTARHVVHYPMKRRNFLSSGPPAPDGSPHYFVPAPSSATSGHPHRHAASHPSEGAAFSFSGGHPEHVHGQSRFLFSDPGAGVGGAGSGGGSVGGGNGSGIGRGSRYERTPQYFPSTISIGSTGESTSNVQTVHTPLSSTSTFAHSETGGGESYCGLTSPPTPFEGSGLFQQKSLPTSNGRSASGPVGFGSSQYHGAPIFTQPMHTLPPPPPGMMWFKTDNSSRSVSAPSARSYSSPYTAAPFGGVGGGFTASQLALPSYPHQHLAPPFYHIPPPPRLEIVAGDQENQQDEEMREDTPEPLVDINAVPHFHFYPPPPANTPINGPFSAVETQQTNLLTHGPPQMSVHSPLPGRLHSAPPFLQRFNSQPSIPTMSSWSNNDPWQSSGGYGDAHSIGGGRSGDDEEWQHLEEQMLSRDVSTGPEESTPIEQPEKPKEIAKPAVNPPFHWGAPMAYPQSSPDLMRRNPFSLSASTTSTSSTLLGAPDGQSYPNFQSGGVQQPLATQHPSLSETMAMTPINPHGFYPTPMTPWSAMSQDGFKVHMQQPSYSQYVLQSPATICRNPTQTVHQPGSPEDSSQEVQNITLTTPPKDLERRDGVAQVGLGISNVHFEDRSHAIVTGKQGMYPEYSAETLEEDGQSDEGDISEDELDAGADDDSDDEFVPSGRKRPTKKKGGKAARGKGWSARSKRKVSG